MSLADVADKLRNIREGNIFDGGPMLVNILRRVSQGICRAITIYSSPAVDWKLAAIPNIVRCGGRKTQTKTSGPPQIRRITYNSTADKIQSTLWQVRCLKNVLPMSRRAEIHNYPTIAVTVCKTVFGHHRSEQRIVRPYLSIQISQLVYNVDFQKSLQLQKAPFSAISHCIPVHSTAQLWCSSMVAHWIIF